MVGVNNDALGTVSNWWDDFALALERAPLAGREDADVAIVGGGMAGILCAHSLARAGFSVAVVTDGALGSGETGRTTAHLSNAIDDRYHRIERMHGLETARICAE